MVGELVDRRGGRRGRCSVLWTRYRLHYERVVISDVGIADQRDALCRAPCRIRRTAAAARSGRLFSGAGRDSLHPESSDFVACGFREGWGIDGWAELGDLHSDGSTRVRCARARHRHSRRSHAGHEHLAWRPRPRGDGGTAICGAVGRPQRPSTSARHLFGYLTIAAGYGLLGASRSVWMAAACAMFAHAGGSTVWVFSTTLLQLHTDDRFRGRVFSADLGLASLTFATTAYLCGRLLDRGIPARTLATGTGLLMLIPAAMLALALHAARDRQSRVVSSAP